MLHSYVTGQPLTVVAHASGVKQPIVESPDFNQLLGLYCKKKNIDIREYSKNSVGINWEVLVMYYSCMLGLELDTTGGVLTVPGLESMAMEETKITALDLVDVYYSRVLRERGCRSLENTNKRTIHVISSSKIKQHVANKISYFESQDRDLRRMALRLEREHGYGLADNRSDGMQKKDE